MRPLMITTGGAPCKVIREFQPVVEQICNCLLLDTSMVDVADLRPISENNPGYLLMNDDIRVKEFEEWTGTSIFIDSFNEQVKGQQGINRLKEKFVLAFAMDSKLGITEKIWKTINDRNLTLGTNYVLFIAGLGGGTGSGSINGIASRYYEAQEKIAPGSKHIVMGILPSVGEKDDDRDRLKFNTVWALYELMRPIKRPNPLILLDNEAMDKNNPKPTKPVIDLIHILCDWRPDRDAGDFFARYGKPGIGCKVMVPYYACIKKAHLRDITHEDIDRSLLNFRPDEKATNFYDDSPGRWLMSINEQDFKLGQEKLWDGKSNTGGMYIVTKGITNELRSHLREKINEILKVNTVQQSDIDEIVEEDPRLGKPRKAEFLILMLFDNPLELSRIKGLVSYVDWLVNKEKKFDLDIEFAHITRPNPNEKIKEFVKAMINDLVDNLECPQQMPKHEIKFLGDRFEVVSYEETS